MKGIEKKNLMLSDRRGNENNENSEIEFGRLTFYHSDKRQIFLSAGLYHTDLQPTG